MPLGLKKKTFLSMLGLVQNDASLSHYLTKWEIKMGGIYEVDKNHRYGYIIPI